MQQAPWSQQIYSRWIQQPTAKLVRMVARSCLHSKFQLKQHRLSLHRWKTPVTESHLREHRTRKHKARRARRALLGLPKLGKTVRANSHARRGNTQSRNRNAAEPSQRQRKPARWPKTATRESTSVHMHSQEESLAASRLSAARALVKSTRTCTY